MSTNQKGVFQVIILVLIYALTLFSGVVFAIFMAISFLFIGQTAMAILCFLASALFTIIDILCIKLIYWEMKK